VNVGRDPHDIGNLLCLEEGQDCPQLRLEAERVVLVAVGVGVELHPSGPAVTDRVERLPLAFGREKQVAAARTREWIVGRDDLPDDTARLRGLETLEQPVTLLRSEDRLGLAVEPPALTVRKTDVERRLRTVGQDVVVAIGTLVEYENLGEPSVREAPVDLTGGICACRGELEE
jgi:hypothetical protein